jgi:transposase InsO family protein
LFLIQDEPGGANGACWKLIIKMQAAEGMSLEQIQVFLKASDEVEFKARNKEDLYDWVNQTLRQLHYRKLKRSDRGLVRRYVAKMTGLSRAQATRLLGLYLRGEDVRPKLYRRRRFPQRYTREDAELLAAVDEAHDTLSGPATRKILQRARYDFQDAQYTRLAELSVAQLYRLRKSRAYRHRLTSYQPTRPTKVAIGERRRPEPNGRPGYLRVDTVHQGDQDGIKGVYHINAVDEVTQWEVVGAAAQISEAWLIPVLDAMLAQFPFRIQGFHSDNGSEFINHTVAKLLNKLLIQQTKSRPRHSNDNGLVEAKNGAVVRKHMGYSHITAPHAVEIEAFYERHLNPYLNFHRPCGVPEEAINAKGKVKRMYRWYATPWEIMRQLPDLAKSLKAGVTIQDLEQRAGVQTDTAAAVEMQKAKAKLFASFEGKKTA